MLMEKNKAVIAFKRIDDGLHDPRGEFYVLEVLESHSRLLILGFWRATFGSKWEKNRMNANPGPTAFSTENGLGAPTNSGSVLLWCDTHGVIMIYKCQFCSDCPFDGCNLHYFLMCLGFGLVDSYNLNSACLVHDHTPPHLYETMRRIGPGFHGPHLGKLHHLQCHRCEPQLQLRVFSSSYGLFRPRCRRGSFSRHEISSHRAKEERNSFL